jgi:hypothetical protein
MTTNRTAPATVDEHADEVPWPRDDVLVLRSRPIRLGSTVTRSRLRDDVWHMRPAHPDPHSTTSSLNLAAFPAGLQRHFRAVLLAVLDHPRPVEPGGRQSPSEQVGIGTMPVLASDLQLFAHWLADQGFQNLSEVTATDLGTYLDHVKALDTSKDRMADAVGAVRTLWLFGDHLPAPCRLNTGFPWPGRTANSLVDLTASRAGENKTPRIADATMEALLAWVITMIEEIGPDIRDALHEYQLLSRGEHPSQHEFTGTMKPRVEALVARLRREGTPLPGKPGSDPAEINFGHIERLVGLDTGRMAPATQRWLADCGLPVASDTTVGTITGQVNGRPWRASPIATRELPVLWRHLNAALFVAVCYLSGMRPGEALSLRRGCRGTDADTGALQITGRRGKGYDRTPDTPDVVEPERPWTVVALVHAAVELLESLNDLPYLFPSALNNLQIRPREAHARKCNSMNQDITALIAWVNADYCRADGADAIPADPSGSLYTSRFRRTLARFIVRRPGGLIATALQYGHIETKVTLSYAGSPDNGWMTDLTVERLELVLERIEDDATHLRDGEHVSGPSAEEYRTRIAKAAPFPGRVVVTARSAQRLLDSTDPAVHHGAGMTCVWRAETAACRSIKLNLGLPAATAPDESLCRSTCTNLAYTDRDIAHKRQEFQAQQTTRDSPVAPQPLRDRAAAQALATQAIIDRHSAGVRPDEESTKP